MPSDRCPIDPRSVRLPAIAPSVPPPRPFVERRVAHRRAEDRDAHREKVLLARSLDILASGVDAEARLAGLLRLLARTAGARRIAVVADGRERRAAVALEPGDDPADGEALAAWLDAHAPRSRARRAAAGKASISIILAADARGDETERRSTAPAPAPRGHYASLPIQSAGDVVLGFEFGRPADAERLAERLPPALARHAAVALALVTSQLAAERELVDLRARDAERSAFVSTVAHELRTPLTGLRGYLELILDGRVQDAVVERDFLERSRGIVGSMGELVADLLELSRLESGSVELECRPFSLAEAGSQVASALLPIALDRDIGLRTVLPARLRMATGDRRRVEQILVNLAANALKFSPRGGEVEIEGRVDGPLAFLVVRDGGGGIGPDDRGRIFERFHRMAAHERISGTGLGLPIARDLARRMGGDLDVASVLGAGSAFVLVLPGPTAVTAETIGAGLEEALAVEDRRLQDRAVRRTAGRLPGERASAPRPSRRSAGPRTRDALAALGTGRHRGSAAPA